eukprot:TRINITY_DN7169_c0_g1_i4.p1 TRINITY_DN7169_c0_g1~~TRINITY_DN7169_c0_g1_i4.p1  ORF type:complete len:405 (+),score=149.04 TRINITY_DN7169_c0_g1_i4:49-1263(+)
MADAVAEEALGGAADVHGSLAEEPLAAPYYAELAGNEPATPVLPDLPLAVPDANGADAHVQRFTEDDLYALRARFAADEALCDRLTASLHQAEIDLALRPLREAEQDRAALLLARRQHNLRAQMRGDDELAAGRAHAKEVDDGLWQQLRAARRGAEARAQMRAAAAELDRLEVSERRMLLDTEAAARSAVDVQRGDHMNQALIRQLRNENRGSFVPVPLPQAALTPPSIALETLQQRAYATLRAVERQVGTVEAVGFGRYELRVPSPPRPHARAPASVSVSSAHSSPIQPPAQPHPAPSRLLWAAPPSDRRWQPPQPHAIQPPQLHPPPQLQPPQPHVLQPPQPHVLQPPQLQRSPPRHWNVAPSPDLQVSDTAVAWRPPASQSVGDQRYKARVRSARWGSPHR